METWLILLGIAFLIFQIYVMCKIVDAAHDIRNIFYELKETNRRMNENEKK